LDYTEPLDVRDDWVNLRRYRRCPWSVVPGQDRVLVCTAADWPSLL